MKLSKKRIACLVTAFALFLSLSMSSFGATATKSIAKNYTTFGNFEGKTIQDCLGPKITQLKDLKDRPSQNIHPQMYLCKIEKKNVHSGKQSLALLNENYVGTGAFWKMKGLQNGKTYVASIWVKGGKYDKGMMVRFEAKYLDASEIRSVNKDITNPSTTKWTNIKVEFKMGNGTEPLIIIWDYDGTGTIYMDDLTVYEKGK